MINTINKKAKTFSNLNNLDSKNNEGTQIMDDFHEFLESFKLPRLKIKFENENKISHAVTGENEDDYFFLWENGNVIHFSLLIKDCLL